MLNCEIDSGQVVPRGTVWASVALCTLPRIWTRLRASISIAHAEPLRLLGLYQPASAVSVIRCLSVGSKSRGRWNRRVWRRMLVSTRASAQRGARVRFRATRERVSCLGLTMSEGRPRALMRLVPASFLLRKFYLQDCWSTAEDFYSTCGDIKCDRSEAL